MKNEELNAGLPLQAPPPPPSAPTVSPVQPAAAFKKRRAASTADAALDDSKPSAAPAPTLEAAASLPKPAARIGELEAEVSGLKEQLSAAMGKVDEVLTSTTKLAEANQQLTKLIGLMTAGKLSQAALVGGAASVDPTTLGPAQLPEMPEGFTADEYFVRIKPYDPKRKHLRKRQYFAELGRAINGGTGAPGDIPEWVRVNRPQAMALAQYLQDDNDPMSPAVLDVVTPEERTAIDAAEEQHRMAMLGMAGFTPQAMMQAAQRPGHMRARTASFTPKAAPVAQAAQTRAAPSLVQGAQAFAPPAPLPPAAAAGRMAALADVPDARPDRGVAEDLTGEASHDHEAAEALALAEKYAQQ